MILFVHPTPFSTTDFAYASTPRPGVNSSTGLHDLVIVVNKIALAGQTLSYQTRLYGSAVSNGPRHSRTKTIDTEKRSHEIRMILFVHPTPFSTTDFAYASTPRPGVNSSTGLHDLVIVVNKIALAGQT